MERKPFGPGPDVPIVGQGTWQIRDRQQAARTLQLGVELGLTHIDTAESYGTEPVVAQAIRDRREDVFLVTKGSPRNASYDGTIEHCLASLERLGTDHLDVYLLHWPGSHPVEQTMHAMAKLIDDGKIRMAGVSNFDVPGLEAAREGLGGHPLACDQVIHHPGERAIEVEVLPYCMRNNIAVVGYSPFGSGRQVGGKSELRQLEDAGKQHGKTLYQTILDCLTRTGAFTIPKAESEAHVRMNAAALDARLPKDVYDMFDELFPVPTHVEELPTA